MLIDDLNHYHLTKLRTELWLPRLNKAVEMVDHILGTDGYHPGLLLNKDMQDYFVIS